MIRRVFVNAIVAGVLFCLLSLGASAQDGPKRKRFWFRPKKEAEVIALRTLAFLDQDDNGVVTSAEFFLHVKTYSFKRLDANQDGNVSRAEWLAVETGPEGLALFQRWDKNGDAMLTLEEFTTTPEAEDTITNLFRTLDVDGNGKLEASELDIKEVE